MTCSRGSTQASPHDKSVTAPPRTPASAWEGRTVAELNFVHTLHSGAEPTSDPLTLHPLIEEDLDHQMREMQLAREHAAVSGRDYLMHAAASPAGQIEEGEQ
jgi:hypothetical protein